MTSGHQRSARTTDARPPSATGPSWRQAFVAGIATIALAALAAVVPSSPASASPARPAAGCSGGNGVSVVVDFRSLGGGIQSRCAPGSPSSGLDALGKAGVAYATVRGGGFLCQISGVPKNSCGAIAPTNYHWAYWWKLPGGSWQYAKRGGGYRTPPPGSTEGWSFYDANCDGPSVQPPGSSSRPNCRPAPTKPPPPTRPPATRPPKPKPPANPPPAPRPPSAPGRASPGNGPSGGGPSDGSPAGGSQGPDGSAKDAPSKGNPSKQTSPPKKPNDKSGEKPDKGSSASDGSTTTTAKPGRDGAEASTTTERSGSGDAARKGDGSNGDDGDRAGGDEAAIGAREGTRDLSDDGTSSGSPLPVVIGVVLVGALALLAVGASRRRNRTATG